MGRAELVGLACHCGLWDFVLTMKALSVVVIMVLSGPLASLSASAQISHVTRRTLQGPPPFVLLPVPTISAPVAAQPAPTASPRALVAPPGGQPEWEADKEEALQRLVARPTLLPE